MNQARSLIAVAAILSLLALSITILGQQSDSSQTPVERSSVNRPRPRGVRPVTIPITVRGRGSAQEQEVQPIGNLTVREDGEEQQILSVRSMSTAPISVAVLIQDDVVPSISNEIKVTADFIRGLPRGSRVMVAYIRAGSLLVSQRFTTDLEQAASSLRIPIGSASAAPFSPYQEIRDALKRFESLPSGRRAMLVVSDGLDVSRGVDSSTPSLSIELERAIREAQRRSVAIYSFFAPTVGYTERGNQTLISNGQSSLQRLSDETGGRAYFQGTHAPVSFDPFLRELGRSLTQQLALTYLSTHPQKGFHRIDVKSDLPGVEVDHPAGYTR
ncbi:MAG TPA: hypothetical protein VK619_17490 [Pyrinomonadaceae bacterium]|nr:hypothetical protein [Pyrinomonadaceae bacterium]